MTCCSCPYVETQRVWGEAGAVRAGADEFDQQHCVRACGRRVHARARLCVAVNDDRVGEGWQNRSRNDGLHAAARNVESDHLCARLRVRVEDGLTQAAGAAVVRVRDDQSGWRRALPQQDRHIG